MTPATVIALALFAFAAVVFLGSRIRLPKRPTGRWSEEHIRAAEQVADFDAHPDAAQLEQLFAAAIAETPPTGSTEN